jgi:predicted transcriptional regulator
MENRRIIISDDGMVIVPDEVKMNISEIADLFGIYYRTIKQHIRSIERSGIATGDDTMGGSVEGRSIYPDYYGLEMILVLVFRIRSYHADILRKWIMEKIATGSNWKSILFIRGCWDQNFSLN